MYLVRLLLFLKLPPDSFRLIIMGSVNHPALRVVTYKRQLNTQIFIRMKNFSLAALFLVATSLFMVSCATQQGTTTDITKSSVQGNWIVTDVQFEGIPAGSKVTVFDEASYKCFKGSQWVLPSNAYGSYTLSSTEDGCSTATQPIVWSLFKQGGVTMFQFKKTATGIKAKTITDGYRVEVTSAGSFMTWRAAVNFEGQNGAIIYSLQRR